MATAQEPFNVSPEDQAQLQHLSDLLHLFHHRNKNQHRRSVWYRHFSVFRKQLNLLVQAITQINSVPKTNLERARRKVQDAKIIQTTTDRISFWRDVMVAKWQHVFSQVVADGRFSVLGLVLMAALAEVCRIVCITAELEELGQGEVEKVLEEFGREEWGAEQIKEDVQGEDVGEVIRRSDPALDESPPQQPKTKKRPLDPEPKPLKKKRRKKTGNAIDDIFG